MSLKFEHHVSDNCNISKELWFTGVGTVFTKKWKAYCLATLKQYKMFSNPPIYVSNVVLLHKLELKKSDWHPSRTMISYINNLLILRLRVIYLYHWSRSSRFQMFFKISQNSGGNTRVRVSLYKKLRPVTSLKKETLTYVYSCKFYEIFNTCFKIEGGPFYSCQIPWVL